jgi:hypothetical protein
MREARLPRGVVVAVAQAGERVRLGEQLGELIETGVATLEVKFEALAVVFR